MRLICGTVGTAALWAALAAPAFALDGVPSPPPVPAPPVPTPTLPAVTVPAPTVPAVTTPTVTPAPPTPAPAPPATTQTPAASAGATARPAAQSLQPGPAAAPRSVRAQRTSQQPAAPRRAQRAVRLTFRLGAPAALRLSLTQLAPDCRRIVAFSRAGHAGGNALPLGLRFAGRALTPGTYRLVVRSPHALVLTRRFVVRNGRVLRAPGRNTCPAASSVPAARVTKASSASAAAAPAPAARTAAPQRSVSAAGVPHPKRPEPFVDRVLGATFTKQLDEAPNWLRPIMLAFLAAAILLLGTAALPQRAIPAGRALAVLERRRLGLAISGAAVVGAIAIAALLS